MDSNDILTGGPPAFDEEMHRRLQKQYYDVKGLWGNSVGVAVFECMNECGVVTKDFERLILVQYFDAGMMLRLVESRRLSETEHRDVVTGGAYSLVKAGTPPQPRRTGCLLVLAAFGIPLGVLLAPIFGGCSATGTGQGDNAAASHAGSPVGSLLTAEDQAAAAKPETSGLSAAHVGRR